MINVLFAVIGRIVSNSVLNIFQKVLTGGGTKSSVVNFYTYFGLSILCIFFIPFFELKISAELLLNVIVMGCLGALGNYFIIKALSLGELSVLAPINSYKPIVALAFGFFFLGELPSIASIIGILLIISGTYILHGVCKGNGTAVLYRVLALIFSGTEAVFIKKVILLTNIPVSFALWAFSGLIFSAFFLIPFKNSFKISSVKNLIFLIVSVAAMQYLTNYVFSKMNVSYALALFQLSTVLSVFLGINIFRESNFRRKIIASLIMIFGAVMIILCG